jgi:Short C-terminal domain
VDNGDIFPMASKHFPQVAPRRRRGTLSRVPLPPRGDEPAFLEGGDESLSSLPIVSVDGAPGDALGWRGPPASPKLEPHHAETAQEIDIFANIERLAELQQKGILSAEEFAAKKAELLSRLWAECCRCLSAASAFISDLLRPVR